MQIRLSAHWVMGVWHYDVTGTDDQDNWRRIGGGVVDGVGTGDIRDEACELLRCIAKSDEELAYRSHRR